MSFTVIMLGVAFLLQYSRYEGERANRGVGGGGKLSAQITISSLISQ